MSRRPSRNLAVAGMLLAIAAAATAAPVDVLNSTFQAALPALLKNTGTSYPRSWCASHYIMWATRAFPVALSDSDTPLPVVAAVQLDSGSRVVAFGHEGMASGCCSTNDANDQLVQNAFRWLADAVASRPAGSKMRIATLDSDYLNALTAVGKWLANKLSVTVSASVIPITGFPPNDTATKGPVDIYWIDSYTTFTPAQVAALLAFTKQAGRGLIVTGHAWWWSYSHSGVNPLLGHPVNAVLWPLGLGLTTDYDCSLQAPPAKPPAKWLYYNSNYTVARILEARTATGRPFESTMYNEANAGLLQLMYALPGQYNATLGNVANQPFQPVWDALIQAKNASAVGVGPSQPFKAKGAHPSNFLEPALDMATIASGSIANLKASKSAALYPGSPNPITSKPGPDPISVSINTTYLGVVMGMPMSGDGDTVWRSTGLYAPAGGIVNVTIETKGVGKGLKVQIGAHTDDLSDKDDWYRVPYAVAQWNLDSASVSVGSPLGGLIYIVVPKGLGTTVGMLKVDVKGALRAPYYQAGVTTKADWVNTIRNYPAPWAELDNGKITLMVPSKAIRTMADPAPLMTFWARVMDGMAWLSNTGVNRPRAERFLVDADISAGWMHNGYPIMAYDEVDVWQEILNVTNLQTQGAWGPFHELGHNHQWTDMQFSGTGESFNNLFTVYITQVVVGLPPRDSTTPAVRAAARKKYISDGRNWKRDWNVWVALDTYLQLQEAFTWTFYRNVFVAYQALPARVPDADRVQTWIQITSKVAGKNLVPFYQAWGFPVTQATIDATKSLPMWTTNPMANV